MVQKGLSEEVTMIKMVSGRLGFDSPNGSWVFHLEGVQLKLTGNKSLEIMQGRHLGYLQEIRSQH